MIKPYIAIVMAALSIMSSATSHQEVLATASHTASAITISQSTLNPDTDASFCDIDQVGSFLVREIGKADALQPVENDFLDIPSLCDQAISRTRQVANTRREIPNRSGMFGRLVIPDAGIDVALIVPSSPYQNQAVTDAKDSACLMIGQHSPTSKLIADHNNQAFRSLSSVTPDMSAYIITADSIINLTCTTAINGHNTTYEITDLNYNSVADIADYVCYTCQENWRNVRVVGFNVV